MTPEKEGPPTDEIDNGFAWIAILEWVHSGNFKKAKSAFLARCKEIQDKALERDEKRRAALENLAEAARKFHRAYMAYVLNENEGLEILKKTRRDYQRAEKELDVSTPAPQEQGEPT